MFFIAAGLLLAASAAYLIHQYRSGAFVDDNSTSTQVQDDPRADSDLKAA